MKYILERVFSDLIEFAQRRDLEAERLDKLSDIDTRVVYKDDCFDLA